MSAYFDNPNRLRLIQPNSKLSLRDHLAPGNFVGINGDSEDVVVLGDEITMVVMDIRPVVALFGEEPQVFHDPEDIHYQDARRWVSECETRGGANEAGCYGFELAVKIHGKKYIYPCCSKTTRRLLPVFKANLNVAIRVSAEKVETSRYSWYQPEVWVRASQVVTYKRDTYTTTYTTYYDPTEDFS